MTERLHFHFSLSCIGEGNGNPLQCSCLENPRDGGAWWAGVFGGHTVATKPLPLLLLGGKVETEAGRAESGSAIPGPRGEYFPLSCPLSPEDIISNKGKRPLSQGRMCLSSLPEKGARRDYASIEVTSVA